MGMDVFGLNPTSDVGEYFRRNNGRWRLLVDLCETIAPNSVEWDAWHFNDGAGLDADGASELAMQLETAVLAGRVKAHVEARDARLAEMPNEACEVCGSTGVRTHNHGTTRCNFCNGRGHRRPLEALYPLKESDVVEFISFLKNCGGFEIH